MKKEIPAVSVVVPMYNTEKYIGELMDSMLVQTLQNFELIIVDNGSTDNGASVVENYIAKFDGRLKFTKIPVNSGNPAFPRNMGLELSRGEYIFFMDSDDVLIKKTALEEIYTVAENFQADVVYCENYGVSQGFGRRLFENVRVRENPLVKETGIISNDLAVRLSYYLQFCFEAPPWLKLSRRDFLIKNHIDFPSTHHEDNLWTLKLLCLSEKFVITPSVCYINRQRDGSETDSRNDFGKQLRYFMDRTVSGMKILDDFMNGLDFFKIHPEFRYAILNFYTTIDLNRTTQLCTSLPPHVIQKALKDTFAEEINGVGNSALISYLITNNIMLMRDLIIANQKISAASAGDSFNLGTK